MESTTAVRCPACGYDGNNPYFRFCGICGTALQNASGPQKETRAAAAPAKSRKEPALAISSFSILGLQDEVVLDDAQNEIQDRPVGSAEGPYSDEPRHHFEGSRNASYLLEDDEPRRPRWRLYAGLAVLALACGALAWQWQQNGPPWLLFMAGGNTTAHAAPVQEAPMASSGAVVARATPPAPSSLPAPQATEAPSPQSLPETPAPGSSVAEPSAAQPGSSNTSGAVGIREQNQNAAPIAKPSATPAVNPNVTAANSPDSPPLVPPQSASISSSDPMQLFEEGQKYLYGDGVEKDCGKALQDLRESAHSNAEAASLLGTMYASGHCVGRNLAPAYHWYARALHREPSNARFQSDLTVLWNQMTPAEKQAALRIVP